MFHAPSGAVIRRSYAQVWQEACAVARALIARGVTKETRVGLLATNRPEWITGMFGIALAGGTCVALSTFAKGAELENQLRTGDVAVLIFERSVIGRDFAAELVEICPDLAHAQREVRSTILPFLRRAVCIGEPAGGAFELWSDFLTDDLAPESLLEPIAAEVAPTDRGLVFFSSGTTAKPKAIVHAHRAAALQCWRWRQIFALDSNVRTWSANGFFWSGNFRWRSARRSRRAAAWCCSGISIPVRRCGSCRPSVSPCRFVAASMGETHRRSRVGRRRSELAALCRRPLAHAQSSHGQVGLAGTHGRLRQHRDLHARDRAPERHARGDRRGQPWLPLPGNTIRIIDPMSGRVLPRDEAGEIAVKGPP